MEHNFGQPIQDLVNLFSGGGHVPFMFAFGAVIGPIEEKYLSIPQVVRAFVALIVFMTPVIVAWSDMKGDMKVILSQLEHAKEERAQKCPQWKCDAIADQIYRLERDK